MTWQRESSAPFSAKLGFSVVAPISTTVPSLHHGQEAILLGAVEAMDLVHEGSACGGPCGGAAAPRQRRA